MSARHLIRQKSVNQVFAKSKIESRINLNSPSQKHLILSDVSAEENLPNNVFSSNRNSKDNLILSKREQ